jgi:hypothetical protein
MSKNGRRPQDKRIALVIGSGAVKCAAALGLWKVLDREEIITILPDFDRRVSLFDTDQFPYVIAQGEKAMQEQLGYLQQLLEAVPSGV